MRIQIVVLGAVLLAAGAAKAQVPPATDPDAAFVAETFDLLDDVRDGTNAVNCSIRSATWGDQLWHFISAAAAIRSSLAYGQARYAQSTQALSVFYRAARIESRSLHAPDDDVCGALSGSLRLRVLDSLAASDLSPP